LFETAKVTVTSEVTEGFVDYYGRNQLCNGSFEINWETAKESVLGVPHVVLPFPQKILRIFLSGLVKTICLSINS